MLILRERNRSYLPLDPMCIPLSHSILFTSALQNTHARIIDMSVCEVEIVDEFSMFFLVSASDKNTLGIFGVVVLVIGEQTMVGIDVRLSECKSKK